MTPTPGATDALVAREAELGAIGEVLAGDSGVLVLEGAPGIGKTSLWERGVEIGRQRGKRVLSARASGAETEMPFAALIDLLDGVTDDELAVIPAPQRYALNVALFRENPSTHPPAPQAIALGLLSALRLLATEPLLVAIDDVQWLDRASEDALAYAGRRLTHEPVTFLLARRPGPRSALETELGEDRVRRVEVLPTSLGATRQILATRLGLRLPHHMLRRVYDTTLGNPLFAIEVGRVLARRDIEALGDDVPVPHDVDDLLGLRVGDLDAPVRRALHALALDADLRAPQLRELAGAEAVDSAVGEGVVVIEDQRVRPSHPLLAAAANSNASTAETRDLHLALADVVTSDESRALHLALATDEPDEELAEQLAAASASAASRGASRLAVELGSHALRLTSEDSPTHPARLLDLGQRLAIAGEKQRLTDLVGDRVASLPTPADRVAGYLLLTKATVKDNSDIRALLERALEAAGDDAALRVPVLAELAENEAAISVEQISHAGARATEAAETSTSRSDHRRLALSAMAWTRALAGQPVADLVEPYHSLSDESYMLSRCPERVVAQRHVWRAEIGDARELLRSLRWHAEDRAEPSSYALIRLHIVELALRVGDWGEAEHLLDDWGASTDNELLHWPMYERCRALLAAGHGDPARARHWAGLAIDRADATGGRWDFLEATRALGLAALVDNDVETAAGHFGAVWDHTEREGVLDPGIFPVAPDLVEALVEVDAADRARAVSDRLAEQARELDHAWAHVGARRSAALVQLADEYGDEAAAELEAAAATYGDLGLRFEQARTHLALGRAHRRARKWGAARDALDRAAAAFEEIGSPGWADTTRAELERVGARKPAAPGRLTPTEGRVAALAADGLSNKEIARTLVVTVNTVEFHLRNTFAKLGIRSRAQLAATLTDEERELGQTERF